MKTEETDNKPPRYMLVLVDFKTDTQRQVGAQELMDFLNPLTKEERKLFKSTDLYKFITFFKKLVKDAEKDPWPSKVSNAIEAEVVKRKKASGKP